MKNRLMVDAEVTLKFIIPNVCFQDEIDDDGLENLVRDRINEEGFVNFLFDDSDCIILNVKPIS